MATVVVLVLVAVVVWVLVRTDNTEGLYEEPDQYKPVARFGQTEVRGLDEPAQQLYDVNAGAGIQNTSPLTGEQRREMELFKPADVAAGATLAQIVGARRTWNPILQHWYGQDAPDFALTDLQDKQHRLSDYKGRNVLIIFWATWCPPCKSEIPHLTLLQKRASSYDLKILAVTNENKQKVQKFASDYGINYTILFDKGTMTDFYWLIQSRGIPSAAYIDPQGKVKFVTLGLVPFKDIQAILSAKQ
jgi:peroxiredoxin